MGGGSSRQESEASYPPEFAPLASAAVQRIKALQDRLPVEEFAKFAPAGTAGTAPAHQFAMETLLPRTMLMPSGTEGLFALQKPVGYSALGAAQAGAPTAASDMALRVLARQLGEPAPQARSSSDVEYLLQQTLPNVAGPQAAFGASRPADLLSLGQTVAGNPVPVLGGPGPSVIEPNKPLSTAAFPAPFDMSQPGPGQATSLFRGALNDQESVQFDDLVSQGFAPEAAFNQIIGARRTPPPAPPPPPADTGGF